MPVKKKVLSKSTKATKLKAKNVKKVVKPLTPEQKKEKLANVLVAIAGIGQAYLSEANLRQILGEITVQQNELLEYHLNRVNRQLLNKDICNAIANAVLR